MKVFQPIEKAYIERNASILRAVAEMKEKGKKTDEIYPALSKRLEVSRGLIHSVLYHPNYAFYQEARDHVKEELKKMEEEGKAVSQALANIVGYKPSITSSVPNC